MIIDSEDNYDADPLKTFAAASGSSHLPTSQKAGFGGYGLVVLQRCGMKTRHSGIASCSTRDMSACWDLNLFLFDIPNHWIIHTRLLHLVVARNNGQTPSPFLQYLDWSLNTLRCRDPPLHPFSPTLRYVEFDYTTTQLKPGVDLGAHDLSPSRVITIFAEIETRRREANYGRTGVPRSPSPP